MRNRRFSKFPSEIAHKMIDDDMKNNNKDLFLLLMYLYQGPCSKCISLKKKKALYQLPGQVKENDKTLQTYHRHNYMYIHPKF